MDPLKSTFVGETSGIAISKTERPVWMRMAARVADRLSSREQAKKVLETDFFEKQGQLLHDGDRALF